MSEQHQEGDSVHPWQEYYNPDSSRTPVEGMSSMFSECTLQQVQRFRNISKNQWIKQPRMSDIAKHPKNTYITSTEIPDAPFAFYSVISKNVENLILTPVFKEVVADNRLDLQLIHINKNARDTLNPGLFDHHFHYIGDVLCITKLQRKPNLIEFSIDDFKQEHVLNPSGKSFWEVAEYHQLPQKFAENVITSPYRFMNDKYLCVAANFPELIEMPNWPGFYTNQLLSTMIFFPSIKPGQFLSTLKKEELLTVAKKCPRLLTSNTYSPAVIRAYQAPRDVKNAFYNYRKVFKFWNRESAYNALKMAIEFGSNGFSAIKNSQIDTNQYITKYDRYYILQSYVYFRFTIVSVNCAPPVEKWNRAVSIKVLCDANKKSFFAEVTSARKSSELTLEVEAKVSLHLFDKSLIEELKDQYVTVFQRREIKACEINYQIEAGSHADKLIQTLYGGPRLPRVFFPRTKPLVFGEITLLGTQTRYAQMVANVNFSAVLGSSSFGCGKTAAIAAAALYAKYCNKDDGALQMITAVTNSAVTAMIDKLVQLKPGVKIVRISPPLGTSQLPSAELSQFDYPTSLTEFLRKKVLCLDNGDREKIPKDLLSQMMAYLKKQYVSLKLASEELQNLSERSSCFNEQDLLDFYMKSQQPYVIVGTYKSICIAFTSLWKPYINKIATIQIDEASTLSRESILQLVTLFPNARYSLVGDYRQLSPYHENDTSALLTDISIGDTLQHCVTKNLLPSVFFNGVFRCRREITELLGHMFYNSSLRSLHSKSYTERQMKNCPAWKLRHENCYPIVFINTVGSNHQTLGTSLRNIQEAESAMDLAKHLLKFVNKKDIAILCFYKGQANEMRFFGETSGIYVGSIDSAQRREWPICIICTTRTDNFVGSHFLTSSNRINVALSRSKHMNFIFGHVDSMWDAFYWRDVAHKCIGKKTFVERDEFNNIINSD